MLEVLGLTTACLFDFLAALAFFACFGFPDAIRRPIHILSASIIFFSPCLVPIEMPLPRLVAALVAITLLVKMYDVAHALKKGIRIGLASYIFYLPNGFWLVLSRRPTTPRAVDSLRTASYTLPALLTSAVLSGSAFRCDWSRVPFLLEHCCKVVLVFFTTVFLANLSAVIWRLAGGIALDPMNGPAWGQTPAIFWRRWNRPAQQFFYHYVFLPSDGARIPVRATLVTFFVSGLVHEYVFGIAANRIQGWQLVFFMLQGCAAAATLRIQPQKHAVPAWIAGTVLFNLVTSVFFFKSVDALFPFYSPRD